MSPADPRFAHTTSALTPCRSYNCNNRHPPGFAPFAVRGYRSRLCKLTCGSHTGMKLAADTLRYVCSILESTPTWVDQVTVEPDGRWSMVPSNLPTKGRSTQLGNTDCDVVEIDGQSSEKRVTQPTPSSRTPTTSSREASITSNAKSSGSKRPHSVMIDLTLSSDDEEEAKRETKRYVNSQGNRQEAQASRFSGNRGRDAGATTPTSATAPAQSTNSNRDHSQHAFDFGFSR